MEKQFSELKKFDTRRTPFQKAIRVLLFILVCILAGSLIYQATPKNMAEYWGVDERWDSVSRVEITVFDEGETVTELTNDSELEAFYTAMDESKLKRQWDDLSDKFGRGPKDTSTPAFTSEIRIYLEGDGTPEFEAGLAGRDVYFLYMPTYLWYLTEGSPVLEYLD